MWGMVLNMEIYEKIVYVLTQISKTKRGIHRKESDQNVLLSHFKCKITIIKSKESLKVYNPTNTEVQENFQRYTDDTIILLSIIDEEGNIDQV